MNYGNTYSTSLSIIVSRRPGLLRNHLVPCSSVKAAIARQVCVYCVVLLLSIAELDFAAAQLTSFCPPAFYISLLPPSEFPRHPWDAAIAEEDTY